MIGGMLAARLTVLMLFHMDVAGDSQTNLLAVILPAAAEAVVVLARPAESFARPTFDFWVWVWLPGNIGLFS